ERQVLRFGRVVDEVQAVAQPLDRRARDEDAALQRVHRLTAGPAGDRGEQPTSRLWAAPARVQQQEGPGAIGVLRLSRRHTALPVQRCLLVTGHPCDGELRAPGPATAPG